MPLHLLGKKSWNVYNQDNIAKVKRDEAAAKAKEEAEEQQMQEADAERRMQLLRGEIPTPLPESEESKPDIEAGERRQRSEGQPHQRKKRKRVGEDDTDFEMRIAHEQTAGSNSEKQIVLRKAIDAPIVDHAGHVDLFPQERQKSLKVEKNEEAEREAAKKRQEYEDQYRMRFTNAAGLKQSLENPWYSKAGASVGKEAEDLPGKDVWGNEDPRRKEREAARVVSNDPLAMMRRGAAQVRRVEKERKRWREEKEREMQELEAEEKRQKRKRRRTRADERDDDDLEGFMLDGPRRSPERRKSDDRERERRHRHRHRHSHRDEDRRHRHRHRHRDD